MLGHDMANPLQHLWVKASEEARKTSTPHPSRASSIRWLQPANSIPPGKITSG